MARQSPTESNEQIPQESRARQHERRDLRLPTMATALASLVALVVVCALAMNALLDLFSVHSRPAAPPPRGVIETAPPRLDLEVEPGELLRRLRLSEADRLGRYEWIDRDAGIVRIPIGRAMELVVERGLPTDDAEVGQ